MSSFYIFLTVLYIIACIFLILFILLQSSKNSMGILGGTSNTLLGSSSGDIFTKITAYLATIFFVGAVVLSIMSGISKNSGGILGAQPKQKEDIIKSIEQKKDTGTITNLNILKDIKIDNKKKLKGKNKK